MTAKVLSVESAVTYPEGMERPTGRGILLVLALVSALASACAPKAARIPGPLAAVGRGGEPFPLPAGVDAVPARHGDPTARSLSEAAMHYLEHRPRGFRDDCSGYVEAVFARVGIPLRGSTAMFYELAEEAGALHRRKTPRPGDLAFFDDTYDRNHNGKLDDSLSHVAVVLEVEADGTILLGHGGTSQGRTTLRMNLHHPEVREADGGLVMNDWLRVRRDDDPKQARYLAGELWRAFATLSAEAVAVADP
jgi:peptidoglycan DL-endopeptidase CwlO